MNRNNILLIALIALIPSVIITSYAVQEVTISRDSYSEDNYLLFEDRDGVDQFWVDGDGFVYANGTLLTGGGGTMEQLTNVTSIGCAQDQILSVNSSGFWDCTTPSAGGGGGFSTVYKTADETIDFDSTLTDDADLQFAVDANSIYAVIQFYSFNSDPTPDWKDAWSIPTGSTFRIVGNSASHTAEQAIDDATIAKTNSITSAGVSYYLWITGILTTGGTSGTVSFQWSQNTFTEPDTTLEKGSFIMYKKLN